MDTDQKSAEVMRAIAERRGLGRALALAPETVMAAFERGRPIRSFPEGFSPLTDLASTFAADLEGKR